MAYIIARFGSVANLIDQIVHPLIDSSSGIKPARRRRLTFPEPDGLADRSAGACKDRFSEYNVEAQTCLIAYIDIPKDLLDTQTKKEIAISSKPV